MNVELRFIRHHFGRKLLKTCLLAVTAAMSCIKTVEQQALPGLDSTQLSTQLFHFGCEWVVKLSIHARGDPLDPCVPAVIYTDPELASVGLSYAACVQKYGKDGFDCLNAPEEGTDRTDMERLERLPVGFVELRATKIGGKVLGMTACSAAAAELGNEGGLVITSGLTVRDMACAIHSYPSYGYLLHRIALSCLGYE